MKKLTVKIKFVLNIFIVVMLFVVIFVDGNIFNSMVVLDDDFIIEEVDSFVVNRDSNEFVEEVVVHDEEIVNSYVTMLNAADDKWGWPTDSNYVITSYYGYRWGRLHDAIDISGPGYGSNIYAVNNGVVTTVKGGCTPGYTSCNGRAGNYIVIKHNRDNYYTIYMHLKSINVSVGEIVSKGQVIGTMGNTGNVVPVPTSSRPYNGTHLHFGLYVGEPYKGGYAIDPMRLY